MTGLIVMLVLLLVFNNEKKYNFSLLSVLVFGWNVFGIPNLISQFGFFSRTPKNPGISCHHFLLQSKVNPSESDYRSYKWEEKNQDGKIIIPISFHVSVQEDAKIKITEFIRETQQDLYCIQLKIWDQKLI